MNHRWIKTSSTEIDLDTKVPIYMFHWGSWSWRRYFSPSPAPVIWSPAEWADFWAGVLDHLLYERLKMFEWSIPTDSVILWHPADRPGFIRIALIRTPHTESGEPPSWYDNRLTRFEILLGEDPI